jgi:acetyl-CoA carboxylase biotin carboxyl carrier protein
VAEGIVGTGDKKVSSELKPMQELYKLMLEKGLDTLEVRDENSHIKLTRRSAQTAASIPVFHTPTPVSIQVAPAETVEPVADASSVQVIASPLAGVFYRASTPTSAPFVKEGDVVDAGQTLCIVEAMKVMNEIKAESHCKIVKILAENARPVTAGQALFQWESA